jgi:hypothetical protein
MKSITEKSTTLTKYIIPETMFYSEITGRTAGVRLRAYYVSVRVCTCVLTCGCVGNFFLYVSKINLLTMF